MSGHFKGRPNPGTVNPICLRVAIAARDRADLAYVAEGKGRRWLAEGLHLL